MAAGAEVSNIPCEDYEMQRFQRSSLLMSDCCWCASTSLKPDRHHAEHEVVRKHV